MKFGRELVRPIGGRMKLVVQWGCGVCPLVAELQQILDGLTN